MQRGDSVARSESDPTQLPKNLPVCSARRKVERAKAAQNYFCSFMWSALFTALGVGAAIWIFGFWISRMTSAPA
jgi:hypothetical protein